MLLFFVKLVSGWKLLSNATKNTNIGVPFSHDIILKQNYITILISLSLVNICQNYTGLYQCASTWNPQLFNPSFHLVHTYKLSRKEGAGTMKIVYKYRSSRLDVLHKNICSENFGKFSRRHPWWGPALTNFQGL